MNSPNYFFENLILIKSYKFQKQWTESKS